MGITTKEVEVKVRSNTVEYYESLGYEIPIKRATEYTRKKYKKDYVYDFNTPIIVKVKDLLHGSHTDVDVLCDYCHKNIVTTKYKDYLKRTEIISKYACADCSPLKQRELNLLIYNVENTSQLDDVKRRMAATNIERYGTITPSKNKDVQAKMKKSLFQHYGVENPMQCHEIREKATATLCSNGTHKTSKQQIYLFNLYNNDGKARINCPVSYYAVDICFPEENIVIEYDGGGHKLREILGQLTKEEFERKEIIRSSILKREGYKTMRIASRKDFLPSDQILLQMLSDAKHYFATTSHTWQTYDIDQSLLFNAENPQGIPYDFGPLRTIKDSDLSAIKTEATIA